MWQSVFVFSVIFALVKGQNSTEVNQCQNFGGDLPINTNIEGCATPPCLLPQLQDVVLHLIFKAPYTIPTMRTLATAYLSVGFITLPIPYDLNQNAITCNFLTNTYCPLIQGEVVQYTLRMYIEPTFPVGTAVTIEFRVVDHNSVPFVCLRVPVRIEPPVDDSSARNRTVSIDQQQL